MTMLVSLVADFDNRDFTTRWREQICLANNRNWWKYGLINILIALKLYKKNYWYLNHTHLFVWHFVEFSECFRRMDKSAPSQVVKSLHSKLSTRYISIVSSSYWQRLACTKWRRGEMTSRRQSWSVLVAEQHNIQGLWQGDVMLQMVTARSGTSKASSSRSTCGLKKRKDIRRYNWYTHNEMPRI